MFMDDGDIDTQVASLGLSRLPSSRPVEASRKICPPFCGNEPFLIFQAYELAIVYKPPYYTCTTGFHAVCKKRTIQSWLVRHFPCVNFKLIESEGLVHRLDVDTSGALVVALTQEAWVAARASLNAHRWEKKYLALVAGQMPRTSYIGTFDFPLLTQQIRQHNGSIYSHTSVSNLGKVAETDFKIKGRYFVSSF